MWTLEVVRVWWSRVGEHILISTQHSRQEIHFLIFTPPCKEIRTLISPPTLYSRPPLHTIVKSACLDGRSLFFSFYSCAIS
jgi:hypothetical protein